MCTPYANLSRVLSPATSPKHACPIRVATASIAPPCHHPPTPPSRLLSETMWTRGLPIQLLVLFQGRTADNLRGCIPPRCSMSHRTQCRCRDPTKPEVRCGMTGRSGKKPPHPPKRRCQHKGQASMQNRARLTRWICIGGGRRNDTTGTWRSIPSTGSVKMGSRSRHLGHS